MENLKQNCQRSDENRIIFLDYLRVIACFMVMLVHSCEPFYLGGMGTLIASKTDGLLVTLIDSAIRASVPLFVMTSSYLLFPLKGETKKFFSRRFKRIVIPFAFWSLMYALIPMYGDTYEFYKADTVWENVTQLCFNFVGAAGHLWFMYMLLGIYLVMPIFSAWVRQVSKEGERWFIAGWIITTFIPVWRFFAAQHSGNAQVMGEAFWNEFGTFYGISGFIGYVVLGHYIKTYVPQLPWKKTLTYALPMLLIGYAINAGGFWYAMPKELPFEGPISVAVRMELTWGFCTTGTLLMTIGYFLVIRKFDLAGAFYKWVIRPISEASFSMYLMHIFWLCYYVAILRANFDNTLVIILLTAVLTYLTSFICSYILHKIPVIGKYV